MIPKIKHSRSQMYSNFNEFEEGARCFYISSHTYPEIFEKAFPEIVGKSPNGWKTNPKGNMRFLWFPPNTLDDNEIEIMEDWAARFGQYVLLGVNELLEDHFSDEIDFCMALDYNIDPTADDHTLHGKAVYLLKYKDKLSYRRVLANSLVEAFMDMPIPPGDPDHLLFTYVPAKPGGYRVPRALAKSVAKQTGGIFCRSDLTCQKTGLKGVSVDQKIPIWEELYSQGCVELSDDIAGKTVIIIDDLYQSGATMWMFARYLKDQGAAYVFGLPCVKTLRDTDNQ